MRRCVLLVHRRRSAPPLELDGRAVTSLAADLDPPERRDALAAGLAVAPGRRPASGVAQRSRRLLGDRELAWRAYAAGLLGDELAD